MKTFFGSLKEDLKNKKDDNNDLKNEKDYRKIKNYLRKNTSNIADDYEMRLKLQQLFYYDIDGIPIAKLKSSDEFYNNDNDNDNDNDQYPYYFQNKTREEIIDIYNKVVKTKYLLKIYNQDELNDYDIKQDIYLDISLKTFRPVYNEKWKEISEEINEVSFDKQKSFYADYLRCYLKIKHFPSFEEFMKFIYDKYRMPVHKDIRIVFNNIDKSYEKVRDYIEVNNMTFKEVSKIIKQSTSISNRIIMEQK
jgi:hypothetical protein